MKKIFISLIVILGLVVLNNKSVKAQSQTTVQPSMTITYLTPKHINPIIEQVMELVDGDELITEEVIYQLSVTKNSSFNGLVEDAEYDLMTEEQRKDLVKKSEVMKIINDIKN